MRILFVTHRLPYPPNKGDKIRSFNILEWLAARHEVSLASVVDDRRDLQYISELERRTQAVAFADISDRSRAVVAARSMLRGNSISIDYFYSQELQQQIDRLIAVQSFDVVLCFSSPMAEYVFRSTQRERLNHAIKIMDLIDVDSYKWQQYAERSWWPMSWVYAYEARTLAQYERSIAREFQHILVVSEQEKKYFPGDDARNIVPIANGVDLAYFAPGAAVENRRPTVVFTGMMDYWPNIDGVTWFVEKVFAHILEQVPDTQFLIVGAKPPAAVRKLARHPGVQVTGFVDDIREYVARADVCVVPLRIARGVQNKILEAMAMAKPVVCTPQAFEGLQARADEDLLVAADVHAFATAVTRLLRAPLDAAKIGANARRRVEQHYSWDGNLLTLGGLLAQPAAANLK